jgi:Bacterial regulatory protein, Fis family
VSVLPQTLQFPAAPGPTVQRLVQEGFDFALVLDAHGLVTGIVQAAGRPLLLDDLRCVGWPLADGVSAESRPKVGELLSANCLAGDGEYRWRHINLLRRNGHTLPVLAKYVELGADAERMRLLIARDLSAVSEMQQQFAQAFAEVDRMVDRMAHAREQPALTEAALQSRIGIDGLDTILGDTLRHVQRRCIAIALARSQGNTAAAALLLGISLEDYRQRYREALED